MGKKLTKAQFARIAELVDLFEDQGLTELAVEEEGLLVELKGPAAMRPDHAGAVLPVSPAAPAGEPLAVRAPHWQIIESPMTGVFYRAPAPDQPPYVEVGDVISIGQTIGLIEAMKVFSEVPATLSGRVVEIPGQNGDLVAEGEPLIVVDPRG